jgi:hypothetical protein
MVYRKHGSHYFFRAARASRNCGCEQEKAAIQQEEIFVSRNPFDMHRRESAPDTRPHEMHNVFLRHISKFYFGKGDERI